MTQYHVSAQAAKTNGAGSAADPFLTIGQAAAIARAGDEVVVHAGTYRESVDPRFGGESATNRIVYRAAAGEPRPVITGSERIDTWQPEGDGVWKAVIPNAFFNGYNPYVETVFGDWTVYPDPKVEVRHLGDVYLNGKSFYEVASLDKVRNPQRWDTGRDAATDSIVPLINPDATVNVWCCAVDDEATTIWANFHEADPNAELTEINVRETCFYPSRPFVNYITVSGFEMAQAACPYTPPTADQVGLVGPHWSRGWVIENNRIHDAKCSAISLGKEISTGDNESTRTHRKSGYQYQKEAVYKALHAGWEKGVVGGHVVRGNVIYDCGQNGVVGHMGCAFSLIEGNHIYRIGAKREFFGWEVAAIKMHAAVDTVVRGNRVHDSVLGMWLDWQAQGTVVDSNVFYRNTRDVMTEVTHGPITFMNNVFASEFSFDDYAQGAAFVNNLFAGRIRHTAVLDRSTPYHFPHVTDVAGEAFVYGGDDRYVNNLFLAVDDSAKPLCTADAAGAAGMAEAGTAFFDGYPRSLEEYEQLIEEAMKNPETKDLADTWDVAGFIQKRINEEQMKNAFLKKPYDTLKVYNSILKMYEYYNKCDDLAQVPNEKGKIKNKYRKANASSMLAERPNLINGGIQYFNLDKNKEALKFFATYVESASYPMLADKELAKNDTLLPQIAYYATLAADRVGDKDAIIKYAPSALSDKDGGKFAMQLMADAYKAKGDTAAWIKSLEEGILKFPGNDYFFANLVDYYNTSNQASKAMEFADKMLTNDPNNKLYLYVKAYLYHNMKEYDNAIEYYKKAIAADPEYAEAYSNVGLVYLMKAQDYADKATTDINDPKYAEAQAAVKKFYEEAKPFYEKARALKPDQKDLWLQGLYRVYYNLNMGPEFEEIDKMMK